MNDIEGVATCDQCGRADDHQHPAEVWCVNDTNPAFGSIEGESYCATCWPFAIVTESEKRALDGNR